MRARRGHWWQRLTRDLILFGTGLGFALNEVVIRDGPERPFTLAFIAAMLGLPFMLRYDEARRAAAAIAEEAKP